MRLRPTFGRAMAGLVVALAITMPSLTVLSGPASAAPTLQMPFPCGTKWRLNTYDPSHAPALDIVHEPQSDTEGQLMVAPADGTVVQSFLHDNAGNMIQIDHGDRTFTTYIHLQSRIVADGDRVRRGDPIARVGHTGETSNGVPHLHYEQGYDADGNGTVTWGFEGAERVTAQFNGVDYGPAPGGEWRNVESKNCGESAPPQQQGSAYVNVRNAVGSWSGARVVDGAGTIREIAIAGLPDGTAHLMTLAHGNIYDNIRSADGSWSGARLVDGGGSVADVAAVATPDGQVHLLTLAGGKVYHNLRGTNGSWSGVRLVDGGGAVKAVAAAATAAGQVHLLTLAHGSVYDNVRSPSGSWSGVRLVDGGGSIAAAAAAATPDGQIHLLTLAGRKVYHNVRSTNGSWSGVRLVDGGGYVQEIAAAATPNGQVHLLTVAGSVYDNIRGTNGSWSGATVVDAGGKVFDVAATGLPDGSLPMITLA